MWAAIAGVPERVASETIPDPCTPALASPGLEAALAALSPNSPMTIEALVAALRCPDCDGAFAYEAVAQEDPGLGPCGLLRCACATYPVVDGIPVLRQDAAVRRGTIADGFNSAVALVATGSGHEALVDMLVAGAGRATVGTSELRRRRIRKMLARRDELSAADCIAEFCRQGQLPRRAFEAAFFRFGSPRHLATLNLASVVDTDAPVLVVGNGFGHVAYSLSAKGRTVIGLDWSVGRAWTARHVIAPEASVVCADPAGPLPIADGAAGVVLAQGASPYGGPWVGDSLAELQRCASGVVLLSAIEPARASVLDDRLSRVQTEADLLRRYLAEQRPDLSSSSTDVAGARRLYYAVADDAEVAGELFRDHGTHEEWPHMSGTPSLNPLYQLNGEEYALRFPSAEFAAAFQGRLNYLPDVANLTATPAEELVARAVLVGMPERYVKRDVYAA